MAPLLEQQYYPLQRVDQQLPFPYILHKAQTEARFIPPLKILNTEVRHPTEPIIEVGPETSKVYIVREDWAHVADAMADRLSQAHGISKEEVYNVFFQGYVDFTHKLYEELLDAFSQDADGKVEIHHFDSAPIDQALRQKAAGRVTLSMDPLLVGDGIHTAGFSRTYCRGGNVQKGLGVRPGCSPLEEVAHEMQSANCNEPVAIIEDDLFSGGSLKDAVEMMRLLGLDVGDIFVGIQVGDGKKLRDLGINVEAVHRYVTTDGSDIFDKVDLGDPRDFLMGASGLVVALPNGEHGRAPYVAPFTSPHQRASVPKGHEEEFSRRLLEMNRQFYTSLEAKLGITIQVEDMDPDFVRYMTQAHKVKPGASMTSLIEGAIAQYESIWHLDQRVGKVQKETESLGLPLNMAFLTVDQKMISEHPLDHQFVDEVTLQGFRRQIAQLQHTGVTMGIRSDASVAAIIKFAASLGMDENMPILAEDGNVLFCNGEVYIASPLSEIANVRAEVEKYAEEEGYSPARTAGVAGSVYGIGEGRLASVSVFGDDAFLDRLIPNFDLRYNIVRVPGSLVLSSRQSASRRVEMLNELLHLGHGIMTIDDQIVAELVPSDKPLPSCIKPTGECLAQYLGQVATTMNTYYN